MNILKGILLKLVSALMFAVMQALVRLLGENVPLGQVVFFRAAFAVVPVVVIYALRNELRTAAHTKRPFGQIGRGLVGAGGDVLQFRRAGAIAARRGHRNLVRLAAGHRGARRALLKERVRFYRWSAVGVGFLGVIVMLAPHLDPAQIASHTSTQLIGAAFALTGAFTNAAAVIQTRRLTDTETTSSIVLYFSLVCSAAGLATLPFGWIMPSPFELAVLVSIGLLGGIAHLILTESYRLAPASVVAPFDYSAIIFAFLLGYAMFGEVPTGVVVIGAIIVVAAGLFVLWRERQLGLKRARDAEGPPSGA